MKNRHAGSLVSSSQQCSLPRTSDALASEESITNCAQNRTKILETSSVRQPMHEKNVKQIKRNVINTQYVSFGIADMISTNRMYSTCIWQR